MSEETTPEELSAPGRYQRYRIRYYSSTDTDRVVFFSDAVFAIAMTLLVLEIKLPELPEGEVTTRTLGAALLGEWPHLLGYAISFLIIATVWVSHHNMWKFVVRVNAGLVWLNIAVLLLVAFTPVPTALIAEYGPSTPLAPVAYALTTATTSLLLLACWSYGWRRHLLDERVDLDFYRMVRQHLVVQPAVFVASCAIAPFSPLWAMLSWYAMAPVGAISRRRFARRMRRLDAVDQAAATA